MNESKGLNILTPVASLNNLGFLLQAQGNLDEAKPYLERALAICEKVLGAEHPDTASSLNSLGDLLRDQGDLDRTKSYYQRALRILSNSSSLNEAYPLTQTVQGKLEALER